MEQTVEKVYASRPTVWVKRSVYVTIVLALVIASIPYVNTIKWVESGTIIIQNILKGLIQPNFDVLFNFTTAGVPYLVLETVAIAFLGTLIGMVISIPFAFITARNIVPAWLSAIGTFLITVIRTFPPFVYGLMLIRVSGPGAFTGVLTLAITSIGMISKLFVEVVEDLDQGILESLDAAGCTPLQKIRYGIVPQLMSNFISIAIYRFELNVKNASILGLVGAGGIGAPLIFAMNGTRWRDAGALLWGLVLLVVVVEAISSRIRKKMA